jgi:phospholipid/cholesterol/gamma-HCH transport system permease protein
MVSLIAPIGRTTLDILRALGHHAFFFADLLRNVPTALRRPYLVVAQIHAIGNLSLVIIMASGLAVGFVLALQMYYALVTYGAAESLGLIVNLSLVRELGPVVTGLLFAGRAGTSLTAEIGLMKAGEQLAAMDMMAIDPAQSGARTALHRRHRVDADSRDPVLDRRHPGRLRRGGVADRRRCRQLLVHHANCVDVRRDVGNGIVKSMVFGVICTFVALYQGYETQATPEGVAHATTRTVVIASLGVLAMDFILTAMMFSTP